MEHSTDVQIDCEWQQNPSRMTYDLIMNDSSIRKQRDKRGSGKRYEGHTKDHLASFVQFSLQFPGLCSFCFNIPRNDKGRADSYIPRDNADIGIIDHLWLPSLLSLPFIHVRDIKHIILY